MTATTLEATKVLDSPAFAWNNWVEREQILNMDFMDEGFQDELNAAAIRVLSRELATSWNARRCVVGNITEKTYMTLVRLEIAVGGTVLLPNNALTEEVWTAAANRMDFDAVLTEAGLEAEYSAFVHAQSDYDL